jgi:ribulose-5-phosphate 4-epimerase/fuculose-1-phosphate aldolase
MDEKQAIATVVDIARSMYDRRMVTTYEGNISVRHGDRMYITTTTPCKGQLTKDMVAILDMSGNIVGGTFQPSS